MSIDREAARYLLDLTEAVSAVKSGDTSYGRFYVEEIVVGYEGERTNYRVIPNEFGDYDIAEIESEVGK